MNLSEASRPLAVALHAWVRAQNPRSYGRGRAYQRDGRVRTVEEVAPCEVRAKVVGTKMYDVTLSLVDAKVTPHCTCMAFEHEGNCKHAVATAISIVGKITHGELVNSAAPIASRVPPIPALYPRDGSARTFASSIELYTGKSLPPLRPFSPLAAVWYEANALRDASLAALPDVERTLQELRAWTPPSFDRDHTAFAALCRVLAKTYLDEARHLKSPDVLPGPLDARHPGFSFSYLAEQKILVLSERLRRNGAEPMTLAIAHTGTHGKPTLRRSPYGVAGDAWTAFALRAALIALSARELPAVVSMATDLGKPEWEILLEAIAQSHQKDPEEFELAFLLVPSYRGLKLIPCKRSTAPTRGRAPAWKATALDAILTAPRISELERAIARTALSADSGLEISVDPMTVHGHEVLRLLSAHPRVAYSAERRPRFADDLPRPKLVIGTLTMKLEARDDGSVSPSFEVAGVPQSLAGDLSGSCIGDVTAEEIRSALVPPSLRPWLDAAIEKRLPDFPAEAVPALIRETRSLIAENVCSLPREALGEELPQKLALGLRVEWMAEGGAVVRAMLSVHPGAPLVDPGEGADLYTFLHGDLRVFVERKLASERAFVMKEVDALSLPLRWSEGIGRTDDVAQALALSQLLATLPPRVRVELKRGRTPRAVDFGEANANLRVRRAGTWLFVDGEVQLDDVKITFGELLDAARLAQRYVRAGEGQYLELTDDIRKKLLPLAAAIDLGEAKGEGRRVNDAFGAVLLAAAPLFRTHEGIDLDAYAARMKRARGKTKRATLEQGALRPYQEEGVAFLIDRAEWAAGAVLADDMGLGKTVQTAAVLRARAKKGPALIVAPASVVSNWERELSRFVPSLRVRSWNADKDAHESLGAGDVMLASYSVLQRRANTLENKRFATLVLDEAHFVKNIEARRTDAVRSIARDFTIALTGTPLENHLGELFSIMDIVLPGLFGSEAQFRERFRKPIEVGGDNARLAALSELLAPFLLRRTRAAVLTELPPRQEIVELLDLTDEERRRYLALRDACALQFSQTKTERKQTPAQLRIVLLAALTRLRQLSCDVGLVDATWMNGSTKITRIVSLVKELTEEGAHALVFSQFKTFIERIHTALDEAGVNPLLLTGDTKTADRAGIVDAFQSGNHGALCVSLMAGGTGLNLTRATYVIHADPWWNPAVEEQATARAHRMGQELPVTVYRLIARGTIEEAVVSMHENKRRLADAVLSGKNTAKTLAPEDLLALISYGGAS